MKRTMDAAAYREAVMEQIARALDGRPDEDALKDIFGWALGRQLPWILAKPPALCVRCARPTRDSSACWSCQIIIDAEHRSRCTECAAAAGDEP